MQKLLLTSGYNFEGYRIIEYLGFYSGECALGTGFLSSLGAGFADLTGANSTMYEGKLSRAKSMAISELEQKAIKSGANAIIGLDVDYTTFTSDIMGVIANGTAVKIEKIGSSESEEKDTHINFPVINYYDMLAIRPFKLVYNKSKKEIGLYIFCYKDTDLTALNVDIVANTIFGTIYEYEDINFVNCYVDKNIVKTENIQYDIPENQLKSIESISVKVNHYILGKKVYSVLDNYFVSNISINEIQEFRDKYGSDIVSDFHENGDAWICMCGSENTGNVCQLCGRKKGEYKKAKNYEIVNLSKILPQLEQLHNCKEILDYLVDIEKNENYQFSYEMMEQLRRKYNFERIYGNEKNEAIDIIKEYIQ